ncbi:MAG: M20 family peptidase [Burkholderiales bacterium]|nr:M20 family peptidase [Burkholderiales bacterium]
MTAAQRPDRDRTRPHETAIMIKRFLLFLLAAVLLLALALVANTLRQGSRQLEVAPAPALAVDRDGVVRTMAAAVRAKTVSGEKPVPGVDAEFDALHALLRERYPRVFAELAPEVVGAHSLLFTWKGSDPALKPVALMAHQDVVPVAADTESSWTHPPFGGVVEGGFVWGRGTLDDKSNLVTQLEALEMLLKAGVKPRRTIYLVSGHDEEIGGEQGVVQIVKLLRERGVRLDWVLDEGLVVTHGVMPGIDKPVALIGLAEKGSVSLELVATAPPGHSSMPPGPGQGAVGRLAAALARLDAQPLPGGIQGAAAEMFEAIAPEMPFGQRLALSNLWLTRPLVERMLAKGAATNAMLRTTTAMTMLSAGVKENVLPGSATAVVNFRILPGDTIESVRAEVRRIVADDAVEIRLHGGGFNPSRLSTSHSDSFRLIERAVRDVFPDALVAPGLMLAASDARHFDGISDASYRFMPIRFDSEDLKRPHGTNERIAVDQLVDMVRFYHRLLEQAAQ